MRVSWLKTGPSHTTEVKMSLVTIHSKISPDLRRPIIEAYVTSASVGTECANSIVLERHQN